VTDTDEDIEIGIAGMVEAVILRRLADVQERAAAGLRGTLNPWRMLGRFRLHVAAGVNRNFANLLDQGTSLAELSRYQGAGVECVRCGLASQWESPLTHARSRRDGTEDCCDDDR
jgi:hypothetical protein